jgi:hypothetical protein
MINFSEKLCYLKIELDKPLKSGEMENRKSIWKIMLVVASIVAAVYGLIVLCFGGLPIADRSEIFGYYNDGLTPYLEFIANTAEATWDKLPVEISRWWDVLAVPFLFSIFIVAYVGSLAAREKATKNKMLKNTRWIKASDDGSEIGIIIGVIIFVLSVIITSVSLEADLYDFTLPLSQTIVFSVMMFIGGLGLKLNWDVAWVFLIAWGIAAAMTFAMGLLGGFVFSGILVCLSLLPSGIIFLLAGLLVGYLAKLLKL